jgi:hypothetical protein
MRIELLLVIATALIVAHIYTEGRYMKYLYMYTKYYRIAGVILGALFIYYVIRKNPLRAREMVVASNEYLKNGGIGIDRTTRQVLSVMPMLNLFSSPANSAAVPLSTGGGRSRANRIPSSQLQSRPTSVSQHTHGGVSIGGQRGAERVKRSVSETKKKFVASRQNWKCLTCGETLPATYQVDHIVPLENYGTNDIQNLRALCPNCHAMKTAMDNII